VVDEERTAIDCIEVRHPSPFHSALPGGPNMLFYSTCATSVRDRQRSFLLTRSK
jgi:hypothetical protein